MRCAQSSGRTTAMRGRRSPATLVLFGLRERTVGLWRKPRLLRPPGGRRSSLLKLAVACMRHSPSVMAGDEPEGKLAHAERADQSDGRVDSSVGVTVLTRCSQS
eukprot:7376991-Prymnesium_polylepis.3